MKNILNLGVNDNVPDLIGLPLDLKMSSISPLRDPVFLLTICAVAILGPMRAEENLFNLLEQ